MTAFAWALAGAILMLLTFACVTDSAWGEAAAPYCVALFIPALAWLAYRYDRKGPDA